MEGYDGILLLLQFVTDDLLYYRISDVPIAHCIEGVQRLQPVLSRVILTLSAFQSSKDTLLLLWIPNIIVGIIVFIEGIIYLTKSDENFERTYAIGKKQMF